MDAEVQRNRCRPFASTVSPFSAATFLRDGGVEERSMFRVRDVWADARHAQIAVLTTLICLGITVFDFNIPLWHIVGVAGSALGMQLFCSRVVCTSFDWRSPLITAASLTLLLRTDHFVWSALAGVIAIGSKFVVRINGKHIFNPANFAIVILALGTTSAWISPGQWGAAGWFAVTLAALGLMVTGKAKRWDVSLMYLASFAAILFGRALWFGDPLAIPLHQLQSGALLIFAFFMISDPMTTPNARPARLIHAVLTAAAGAFIVFDFYRADGVILALVLTAPLVPILDKIFPAERAAWRVKELHHAQISQTARGKRCSRRTVVGGSSCYCLLRLLRGKSRCQLVQRGFKGRHGP